MDENSRGEGGFAETVPSEGGADTVIVAPDGVTVHHCPGGLTEDDLLD